MLIKQFQIPAYTFIQNVWKLSDNNQMSKDSINTISLKMH